MHKRPKSLLISVGLGLQSCQENTRTVAGLLTLVDYCLSAIHSTVGDIKVIRSLILIIAYDKLS